MSTEENKAITRRLIEAANAQDTDVFFQLKTPELAAHYTDVNHWIYATFEGHHIDITDIVAEGDKVIIKSPPVAVIPANSRVCPQPANSGR